MREHLAQAEAEVERQAEQLRMCSRAIDLLNKDKDALTRETCDLTGRLDIARQGCGIAEADRDKWKAAYENLTRRVIGADREVGDE
jgi:hypothetical protein